MILKQDPPAPGAAVSWFLLVPIRIHSAPFIHSFIHSLFSSLPPAGKPVCLRRGRLPLAYPLTPSAGLLLSLPFSCLVELDPSLLHS
ncbi:uncharacterized protein BO80DRAFT_494475, partial [Aspergillus ibericus CBS 121593]